MENILGNIDFEVNYVKQLPLGSRRKSITIELSYMGNVKKFNAITDNITEFDKAMDLESYEDKKMALFGLVENKLQDYILDWAFDIDNK